MKRFLLAFLAMVNMASIAHAVDVSVATDYPSPPGYYKYLEVNEAPDSTLMNLTQNLDSNGIGFVNTYVDGAYTPGIFWASSDSDAGVPKAGIWTWNGSRGTGRVDVDNIPYVWPGDTDGSHLLFGTSGNPGAGIDQTRIVLSPKGYLGVGIDPTAPYEPQSRLWVDNGFVSVQNGPAWSSARWPISYTSGQSAAMTIAGPHELDANATAMGAGDGYLGFGITSDLNAGVNERDKNAGWYFIRARDKFGVTTNAPEYPVVFKGGAPTNSLYLSEEGNVFIGPDTGAFPPAPSIGATITSPANSQATNNLQVNDVYFSSTGTWASQIAGGGGKYHIAAAKLIKVGAQTIPSSQQTVVEFDDIVFHRGGIVKANSSGNYIKVKKNGAYKIVASCALLDFPNGKTIKCVVLVNGIERTFGITNTMNNNQLVTAAIDDYVILNKNDTVQLAIFHNAGVSRSMPVTPYDVRTRMTVYEVAID